MGCRAFLSPWYERGGMEPADENDTPVFVGRFKHWCGKPSSSDDPCKGQSGEQRFYEVLDFYLEMIRNLTYPYL